MQEVIVKNPDELQVITNPTKKTTKKTTMAKKKINTDKALSEFMDQGKTALYILGGQAAGAQINALVVSKALSSQSATIQQAARAGIPAVLGVAATLFSKNPHLVKLAMGLGVQSALELIKFVMPDWTPSQGFGEGSSFVYTDENGQQQAAVVTPSGEVITSHGQKMLAPKQQQSAVASNGEAAIEDAWDSNYAQSDDVMEFL